MALIPIAFIVSLLAASAAALDTRDSVLVPFRLQDQQGNEHVTAEYRGRVVIVIGSDRAGSKYNEAWGRALGDSLRGSPGFAGLTFLGIADTRGVPALFRGL
jgi:hypothetical protein